MEQEHELPWRPNPAFFGPVNPGSPDATGSRLDAVLDPWLYNKDFDPANEAHFRAWLDMCPPHLAQSKWQFELGKLKLMLESESVKTEHDRSMVMLGWKAANGLLPEPAHPRLAQRNRSNNDSIQRPPAKGEL